MAAIAPFPRAALVKVEVDFTSNWNAASPSYTDVTGDLRFSDGLTWERGRNDEFQSVSPGSCQFTLNNRSRTYDPATNANIVPGRPTRITCYYPTTSTAYQQIAAQAEDFTPKWSLGKDAVVDVNCIERFGALAFCKFTALPTVSTTSVGQLNDIVAASGWPSASTSFVAGSWNIATGTLSGDALSLMQQIAASQTQVVYQTRVGVLTTHSMFTGTGSNGGTFGDNTGELPFIIPDGGVGQGYWYTLIEVTPKNGTAQTKAVGSNYPISKYGTRTYSTSVAAVGPANGLAVATSLAASFNGLAPYRLKQITIRPMVDPVNLFPVVLAADFGIPYTFNFQPPGGGSRISITGKLRSIRHEIKEGDWLVTWLMSP